MNKIEQRKNQIKKEISSLPYFGTIEIKQGQYIYLRKRIKGKLTSEYVGVNTPSLYKRVEVSCLRYKELTKELKLIEKKLDNNKEKTISYSDIKLAVSNALFSAVTDLNTFTLRKLKDAYQNETSLLGKETLSQILENACLASKEGLPMCQDTGIVTCFVELGYDANLKCDLYEAINAGVKDAYERYYLRKSVADPLTRKNTQDNTPAIVHVKMVKGNNLKINIAPKGAGSENMSKSKMLNPTDGEQGIIEFVKSVVKEADGKPCPPIILGIGIGGNFETAPLLAKEALLRTKRNKDQHIAELELKILDEVNKLNIGPMGLGGKSTCLDVFINVCPCHIASLPVAVNIQCHANRHVEVIL